MNEYVNALDNLFKCLKDTDSLKAFRLAMLTRAEEIARQQTGVNDDKVLHALRGQLTICFELADGATNALEADKASANARNAEGIHSVADYE